MTHFRIEVDIAAPPERVWGVMSDVERWHEWTPSVTSIERLDSGPFGVGSWALIRQPKLLPAKWQVTELVEGRYFTWVSRGPGFQVTGRHAVEATETGSHAALSIDFTGLLGPLLGSLLRGLNERYLGFEAKGLKERSENGTDMPS